MSNHSIEPWKLTAFLLNELDAEEARQIESSIAADPHLQSEVESLRSTIDRTKNVLAATIADAGLQPGQLAAVEKAIAASSNVDRATSFEATHPSPPAPLPEDGARGVGVWKIIAALAACLLLAFFLLPAFNGSQFAGRPMNDVAELKKNQSPTDDSPLAPSSGRGAGGEGSSGSVLSAKDESISEVSKSIAVENETVGNRRLGLEQADAKTSGLVAGTKRDLSEMKAVPEAAASMPLAPTAPAFAADPFGRQQSATPAGSASPSVVAGTATLPANPTPAPVPELSQRINPSGTNEIVVTDSAKGALTLEVHAPLESQIAENGSVGGGVTGTAYVIAGDSYNFDAAKAASPAAEPMIGGTPALHDKQLRDNDLDRLADSRGIDPNLPVEREELLLRQKRESPTGDRFERIIEIPFVSSKDAPLSTFSIDVDTASYSKLRQYLMQANALPQPSSVRIEEMINYFDYGYAGPEGEHPFASHMAVGTCPWNEKHQLVRIGLQAKKIDVKDRPKANLVFLLDVSGSMDEPNKLPLVKQSIAMLARQLGENDRIAMVVYAGAAGCVLPSITGDHQTEILDALDKLQAGGSTNGGQGIELAYQIAREHFVPGGVNRVILCTDGDFNVGTTSNEGLIGLVEKNAKSKVFLTCLGYGIGNYNDSMMEQITNRGNGTYGMVDSIREARRIMIEQLSGTLMTVAKDVKIQIEFNPTKVARYRLIGYENRRLANEDFNNDAKDAGEIGAGHRVTALYEVVPVGTKDDLAPPVDELRYGSKPKSDSEKPIDRKVEPTTEVSQTATPMSAEWLTLKLRYKQPEGDVSTKFESFLKDEDVERQKSDADFRWASSVAEFGLLLRRSQLAPQADWEKMIRRAQESAGDDAYRLECVEMMIKAKDLMK